MAQGLGERSVSDPSELFLKETGKQTREMFDPEQFMRSYNKKLATVRHEMPTLAGWKTVNGLVTKGSVGGFDSDVAEQAFSLFQRSKANRSAPIFLSLFSLCLLGILPTDFLRTGSRFDVGSASRCFRTCLILANVGLILVWRNATKSTGELFPFESEYFRSALAALFTLFWFIHFPLAQAHLLSIPINESLEIPPLSVWTSILLHLTNLGACAAFRLTLGKAFINLTLTAVQTAWILTHSSNAFSWDRPEVVLVWLVVQATATCLLIGLDAQARGVFIREAKRFETVERVTSMANRLRAAQEFADSRWKTDFTVMALTRIRDDPALGEETAFRKVLDIGISSFGDDDPKSWSRLMATSSPNSSPILRSGPSVHQQHLDHLDIGNASGVTSSWIPSEESDRLIQLLQAWDFGKSSGIWSVLADPDFPAFQKSPLASTIMTSLYARGFFGDNSLTVDVTVTKAYFDAVESSYLSRDVVPYHNAVHAADVVQTCFAILSEDEASFDEVPVIGMFALLFSAAIHDLAHPGVNNAHLVTGNNPLAILYNDRSVLENFHVSTAFAIMEHDKSCDLLATLSDKEHGDDSQIRAVFRMLVIEMVLATDLSHHFDNQARFRARLADDIRSLNLADTSLVLSTVLHAADIGNVGKAWKSYEPWIDLLFAEFFSQGDKERKAGISVAPFMDRQTSIPERAQIAFINNIALPLYTILQDFTPRSMEKAIQHIQENLRRLDLKARSRENSNGRSPSASLDSVITRPESGLDDAIPEFGTKTPDVDGDTSGED